MSPFFFVFLLFFFSSVLTFYTYSDSNHKQNMFANDQLTSYFRKLHYINCISARMHLSAERSPTLAPDVLDAKPV